LFFRIMKSPTSSLWNAWSSNLLRKITGRSAPRSRDQTLQPCG
jgi:hypothetical protein